MDGQWHYVLQGQQEGPVSGQALVNLYLDGVVAEDDAVWTDGMEDWAAFDSTELVEAAQRLEGLAPAGAARSMWLGAVVRSLRRPVPLRAAAGGGRGAVTLARHGSCCRQHALGSGEAEDCSLPVLVAWLQANDAAPRCGLLRSTPSPKASLSGCLSWRSLPWPACSVMPCCTTGHTW